MSSTITKLKHWAAGLKRYTLCLYLVYQHPSTPWHARALIFLVLAYALSPLDLIPDFVPVFGYLDDLILVPAGIWLALKLVPQQVMADCRQRAVTDIEGQEAMRRKATRIVILTWVAAAALVALIVWLTAYHQSG